MQIIWIAYLLVTWAPGGHMTRAHHAWSTFDSRAACEEEARERLSGALKDYPEAMHIHAGCYPTTSTAWRGN